MGNKKIDVLVVRPMERPKMEQIEAALDGYYAVTECDCIQALYPFEDEVAPVCDDEGKFRQVPNRALMTKDGRIYDIVHGTFFICGLGEEDFADLPADLAQKYAAMFEKPEWFIPVNGQVVRIVRD